MTRQELIVAMSRGKCKDGKLFKFSNLDRLENKRSFLDAYKDQNKSQCIPCSYSEYRYYDSDKPKCNLFQNNILYRISDDDGGEYVTEFDISNISYLFYLC